MLLTPGSKVEPGAGDYTITVTEQPGHANTGAGSFPITIANVATTRRGRLRRRHRHPARPVRDPEECVAGSLDGDKTDGTITIVKAEHVTWQISNDRDGIKHAVDTSGTGPNFGFDYPAGSYRVWATADPGYFITTPTSFALTVREPTLDCGLPAFAELPTGASWTQPACTATGIVDPTITIESFRASATSSTA